VTSVLRLALCTVAAALTAAMVPGPHELQWGLALFVLIGGLWVTQALPLAVTALVVPLAAVLAGLLPVRQALASFAHPVIFLFLGGFALGAALSSQGLDKALAHAVVRLARGYRMVAVLLLAGLAALLSMWMSNTATAAMMVPLALGLLTEEDPAHPVGPREKAFVMLVLAYSAGIGGIGTLVGSPPNAIAAAQMGIGFAQWLRYGIPMVLLLWPAMVLMLFLLLRPRLGGRMQQPAQALEWTRSRVVTVVIFLCTVAGWVGGVPLAQALSMAADTDTLVALAAIAALSVSGVLGWKDIEQHTQWGVLLLFGGGLALSEVMAVTGSSRFLAQALLDGAQAASPAVFLLGVVAFVVLLTELVSNTASAALLLPVFLPVATAMGLPPVTVAVAIAMAASCAFMLPVATPPNAIVFATGEVPQGTMMRCGLWLNALAVVTITALALWRWT